MKKNCVYPSVLIS